MRGRLNWVCRGLAALALAVLLAAGWAMPAAAANAVIFSPAEQIDVTDAMDWCETDPGRDVAAIAAGGCDFAPTSHRALALGYSTKAFWLRLTVANPGPQPQERWLVVGQQRLEWVRFFEPTGDGNWRRSTSGHAVPPAERTVVSTDPILPLVLGPGERRTVFVEVVSRSSINLASTLWQERAYAIAHGRSEFLQILAVGGLLVAAIFTLMLAFVWRDFPWSNRANLYFGLSLLTRAVFNACNNGLVALYVLPSGWSFDIRIQVVSVGFSLLFFALFMRHFAGTRANYRAFDIIIGLFVLTLALQIGWGLLIDYSLAFRTVALMSLAVVGCSVALMWRAWRDGVPAAGYLLVPCVINLVLLVHRLVLAFDGGAYDDSLRLAYSWIFLLTVPLLQIGIAVHKDAIQRSLAAARAESAARIEFLARMSHELRTPLDTILGNAQLLSRPSGKPLMAEGLAIIQDSGWRLLRMIDDILDHARGLAGKLAITARPVDWPAFLHALELNARTLAARNRNAFTLTATGEPLTCVQIDEGRLRQVLDNLLVNAARHTKDGRISLDCVVGPRNGDLLPLDFAVSDTGEGIPLADQERIFLPFERGSRTATRSGGKGIGMGLAISRQLVEMMGGRLTVESQVGKGSTFRFQVMAEADDEAAIPAASTTGPDAEAGAGKTLLLADDEEDNRRTLATFLRERGFRVVEAHSGRAASAQAAAEPRIDLVLTDQFMADGDGWMVLRSMARLHPDVPVVLISAAPPDRPGDVPHDLDFVAHFLRPLDQARLLTCIADLLGLDITPAPPQQAEPDAPDIAACEHPDEAAMAELRRMIDNGQVSEIMAWAERLKTDAPRYAAFADEVHLAARLIDFPALNALARDRRPAEPASSCS